MGNRASFAPFQYPCSPPNTLSDGIFNRMLSEMRTAEGRTNRYDGAPVEGKKVCFGKLSAFLTIALQQISKRFRLHPAKFALEFTIISAIVRFLTLLSGPCDLLEIKIDLSGFPVTLAEFHTYLFHCILDG